MIVNPGAGPVEGANQSHVGLAIATFCADLELPGVVYHGGTPDIDGRWRFRLARESSQGDPARVELDMPGLPLERVRYMGEPGQRLLEFPRLYVDGSSYSWDVALTIVRSRLADDHETPAPRQPIPRHRLYLVAELDGEIAERVEIEFHHADGTVCVAGMTPDGRCGQSLGLLRVQVVER